MLTAGIERPIYRIQDFTCMDFVMNIQAWSSAFSFQIRNWLHLKQQLRNSTHQHIEGTVSEIDIFCLSDINKKNSCHQFIFLISCDVYSLYVNSVISLQHCLIAYTLLSLSPKWEIWNRACLDLWPLWRVSWTNLRGFRCVLAQYTTDSKVKKTDIFIHISREN